MTQLLAILRLDLRLFFRDRKAVILTLIVPIAIASFFGAMTGGQSGKANPGGIPLYIANEDSSAVAAALVDGYAKDPTFKVRRTNAASARDRVLTGGASVALLIPKGFGSGLLPGMFSTNLRPELTLLYDPSRGMERGLVEGLLIPILARALIDSGMGTAELQGYTRAGLERIASASGLTDRERSRYRELLTWTEEWLGSQLQSGRTQLIRTRQSGSNGPTATAFDLPLPYRLTAEPVTRSREILYNGYAHSFGGMAVQFVLMAMIDLAVTLLREREAGMFRRFRAAPLSRAKLLLGKGLSYATVALISLSGCFAFARCVFGVRIEGSFPGFLLSLISVALFCSSLGLMLAAIGRTPNATRSLAIPAVLLLVMLGGAWVPTFVFPEWLQQVTVFMPTRWAVDAFDAMTWRGLGFDFALKCCAVLLFYTATFAGIAWARFRWDGD